MERDFLANNPSPSPSPIEQFAQEAHSQQEGFYRTLVPTKSLGKDEQLAFSIDLERCTGCQSCVAACHSMNGLHESETWRKVTKYIQASTTVEAAKIQHVPSSCHHCLEPACLEGCPAIAYEKDPITGIVKHLDDQCIGCRYCELKCPYEVPQYNAALGIVRKCDMCWQRLEVGESPACVSACPTKAITIDLVKKTAVETAAHGTSITPEALPSDYTKPTTTQTPPFEENRTMKPLWQSNKPLDSHWPLVCLLIFSQLSFGILVMDYLTGSSPLAHRNHFSAYLFFISALCSSFFHLGRPQFAFRAILGWKTSWMSREIIMFGLVLPQFTGFVFIPKESYPVVSKIIHHGLLATFAVGIFCSAMIYIDCRRPSWKPILTFTKFLGSSMILGMSFCLLTPGGNPSIILLSIMVLSINKMAFELTLMTNNQVSRRFNLSNSISIARTQTATVRIRFIAGIMGGVVMPYLFMTNLPAASLTYALSIIIPNFIAEGLERRLFFTTATPLTLPKGDSNGAPQKARWHDSEIRQKTESTPLFQNRPAH